MMAKMFYTLEETKASLGRNEEEIKQLSREGRLREFRDGPRLMFKADQVEALKAEMGGLGGGQDSIPSPSDSIGISDTGAPIGLVDSRGASGSGISLVDTDAGSRSPAGSMGGGSIGGGSVGGGSLGGSMGGTGSVIGLAGTGSGSAMPLKEDTALAADLGLGGSMGGVPSPGRAGAGPGGSVAGGSLGGSLGGSMGAGGSRSGINVFSGDEAGYADPSAATNISAGVPDQINLDSVGSGSGLLDLTRESDDTSLGAELLDEISPGAAAGTRAGTRAGVADTGVVEEGPVITEGAPARRTLGAVQYVERLDPLSGMFGWMALGATLFVLFAAIALMGGVLGSLPGAIAWVAQAPKQWTTLKVLGLGAGVTILFSIIGAVTGRSTR